MKKKWEYQSSNEECWICATVNALRFKNINVNKRKVLDIVSGQGLETYGNAGFFTYIPVVLLEYQLLSTFFFPSSDMAVDGLIENNSMNEKLLNEKKRMYFEHNNAMYFFYYALEMSIKKGVKVSVGPVNVVQLLKQGYVVIASVSADEYYKMYEDSSKHVVTLVPDSNSKGFYCIDPLQNMIEEKYLNYAQLYDWKFVDTYLVAI